MEEQQKFEVAQEPQEPQEPKKKGSKKGLVIGIIIVLIAVALGAGYYFFFKNDATKLQLSDKDKVVNSVDKIDAKVGEIFEDFKKIGERKINENLKEKPFTDKYTITGKINEISISDVSEIDVSMAKSMLNGQNIVIDTKGNWEDNKFFAELSLTGEKLGNLVFNNEAVGVQIPSIESKYYTIFKNSLAESEDYAMVATVFDVVTDALNSVEDGKYELTDEELKHFENTYADIIKDNIDKDKISSESVEITVDGETKKCDKVTYSVDAETLKTILNAYITAFENDTEGQDILLDKISALLVDTKLLELYTGTAITADELKTEVKSMLPEMITQIKSEVESLSTENSGKIDIVVYATATTTYKVEVVIPAETGQTIKATIDLEDKGMKISLTAAEQEMMTIDIENKDNKFTATANIMNQMVLDITNEKTDNGNNMVAKFTFDDGYDNITAQLGLKNTIKEDSAKKLDEDIEISLVLEEDEEKIDVVLNINRLAEIVESVDVPELNATNSIDLIKEGYLDEIFGTSLLNDDYYDVDSLTRLTPQTEVKTIDVDELYRELDELENSMENTTVDVDSLGF